MATAAFSNIDETPAIVPAAGGPTLPFTGDMVLDPTPFTGHTATITLLDANGQPTDADGTFAVGQVPTSEPQAQNLILQANAGTEPLFKISPGVYRFIYEMLPAALSADLASQVISVAANRGPMAGTTTIQLSVSDAVGGNTVYAPPITLSQDGVDPVPPPAQNFLVSDQTTGGYYQAAGETIPADGPVAGLTNAFVINTSDILNVTAETPWVFIEVASIPGQQARPLEAGLSVAGVNGDNLLDGGANSNFLVGGSGSDTFYLDERAIASNSWSTIVNFHPGDSATLWGVTAADFSLAWIGDSYGAGGSDDGLTGVLVPKTAGQAEIGFTLAGVRLADLSSGYIQPSFGAVDGNAYLSVRST